MFRVVASHPGCVVTMTIHATLDEARLIAERDHRQALTVVVQKRHNGRQWVTVCNPRRARKTTLSARQRDTLLALSDGEWHGPDVGLAALRSLYQRDMVSRCDGRWQITNAGIAALVSHSTR